MATSSEISSRHEPNLVLLGTVIFVAGIMVRYVLMKWAPQDELGGEPINIAIALLKKGTYGNPYGAVTGPSAHCAPLHPILTAILFWVFGTGAIGVKALGYGASIAASLAYALLPLLARNLGLKIWTGLAAGLAGALLPANYWAQTSGTFEAPYTFLLLTFLACICVGHARNQQFTLKNSLVYGTLIALCILTNPCTILVIGFWFVWVSSKPPSPAPGLSRYLTFAAASAFLLLLPWAIRNKVQLGKLIFTRSNFGLELALSNNSYVTGDLEFNVRHTAWRNLHPFSSKRETELVLQLGEVAYNRLKFQQAKEWITEHPRRFIHLASERTALFWFPRMSRLTQTIFQRAITILAISGFFFLCKRNSASAMFLAGSCLSYSVTFVMIEVSPRYRFPIEGFLLLLAVDFLGVIWSLGRYEIEFPLKSRRLNKVPRNVSVH